MIEGFLSSFLLLFFAELGDKTQLAIVALSARYRDPLKVFLGGLAALALVDGLSVLAGATLLGFVPKELIKIGAAILFIGFGAVMLLTEEKPQKLRQTGSPLFETFSLVAISELGDKTQLASATLGARFAVAPVFFGVLFALALVTALGAFVGDRLATRLPFKKIQKFGGLMFIALGLASLLF